MTTGRALLIGLSAAASLVALAATLTSDQPLHTAFDLMEALATVAVAAWPLWIGIDVFKRVRSNRRSPAAAIA